MDRSKFAQSLKDLPKALLSSQKAVSAVGGLALLATVLTLFGIWHSISKTPEGEKHQGAETSALDRVLGRYGRAIASVQTKVEHIQQIDEENKRLHLENSHLRLTLESVEMTCRSDQAQNDTEKLGKELDKKTGSTSGRALASIPYKAPLHLTPVQLYTLGISYFKTRDDEKAAVILSLLTDSNDFESFKTAENLLMTGVAWYRLDNFKLASTFFDKALEAPDVTENLSFQAQARLWKGLTSERLGQHADAQHWLKELVDHHPHSTEAGWVNAGAKEAARDTASEK